eukprot:CAMPEP_0178448220 /NCGR_PEP_ID=MMETSP0689_2-20121128/41858_1 /TAXON_ID=160604 /ORGANISM="Amphidinium massartii, Strain CS-259" /LENGTH=127 /DNA_ID=CAMNT_0020073371 /DNA_START=149 /DNA_END=533 /DNA_ORIENTATION=+
MAATSAASPSSLSAWHGELLGFQPSQSASRSRPLLLQNELELVQAAMAKPQRLGFVSGKGLFPNSNSALERDSRSRPSFAAQMSKKSALSSRSQNLPTQTQERPDSMEGNAKDQNLVPLKQGQDLIV